MYRKRFNRDSSQLLWGSAIADMENCAFSDLEPPQGFKLLSHA